MTSGSAKTEAKSNRREEQKPAPTSERHLREAIETVVFVLVLVSLLRLFGAEAFVIPTGSMATTLLGAHKRATCPECGHTSCVNANEEVEHGQLVRSAVCQNCRLPLDVSSLPVRGGDRILVSKIAYEEMAEPERWDVVVFKCPETGKPRDNYIKRLIGKPTEQVRFDYGDIYVSTNSGQTFQIARKPPGVQLAERRLVFDNDELPRDLLASSAPRRWQPGPGWVTSSDGKSFTSAGGAGWLTYQHIIGGQRREGGAIPQLITDFEAYNSGNQDSTGAASVNWVGDLMLEARVGIQQLAGRVQLELTEGARVYRLVCELEKETVRLEQNGSVLAECSSPIRSGGDFTVRMANFDDRLTIWVDGRLLFGPGVELSPEGEAEAGPALGDLTPARIGVEGAVVTVSRLRLYRDTYYTHSARYPDYYIRYPSSNPKSTLTDWRESLARSKGKTFLVGPDEFFMLGDNSPCSFDGREWSRTSFVGRHLLLGRALFLYWPIPNWKLVR